MTGGGLNEAGEVEDEDILILSSDKEVSTPATERVSQMLSSSTPAFTGISGSSDLFEPPTHYLHKQKLVKPVLYHQCLRNKKLLLPVVQKEAGSAQRGH